MNNEINQQLDEIKDILENVNCDLALEYAIWTKNKEK